MMGTVVKEIRSQAFDEDGNPVDCGLSNSKKNAANPDGFSGVKETSKEALKKVNEDGLVTGQKALVLEAIRKFPGSCIREIAEIIDLEKSSVSPRLNELRDNHLVYHSGFKVYKDKRVMTWKAN
jgi:DNA-binding transcriptional ArsR family regulator